MSKHPFVLAIGHLPPPVTGFAFITGETIKILAKHANVEIVNIAPPTAAAAALRHLRKLKQVLKGCLRLLRNKHSRKLLYTGCEGDWGLLYTAATVSIAAARGYKIFLHHHSFSYIDRHFFLMQLILRFGGARIEHIFLCTTMKVRFEAQYRELPNSRIISNAAFVPLRRSGRLRSNIGPVRVGFLSNLTREKGLYTFLELIRRLRLEQIDVVGILAGPIANEEDKANLEAAAKEFGPSLEYLGPLFGKEKDHFYDEIDLFVFPTEYANEAQPTVLFEAQAAGNRIVSFDRGCIASQIGDCGTVIAPGDSFYSAAIDEIRRTLDERRKSEGVRTKVREHYSALHQAALREASELLD
ncbi:glycosyltransferase family 4 protein [Bradyrhizobium sp. 25ACV]